MPLLLWLDNPQFSCSNSENALYVPRAHNAEQISWQLPTMRLEPWHGLWQANGLRVIISRVSCNVYEITKNMASCVTCKFSLKNICFFYIFTSCYIICRKVWKKRNRDWNHDMACGRNIVFCWVSYWLHCSFSLSCHSPWSCTC
jgi:hypothetical protein